MQNDRNNWQRGIRDDLRGKYEFDKFEGDKAYLKRTKSMQWMEGKGYSNAFILNYKNVFMQFSSWSKKIRWCQINSHTILCILHYNLHCHPFATNLRNYVTG